MKWKFSGTEVEVLVALKLQLTDITLKDMGIRQDGVLPSILGLESTTTTLKSMPAMWASTRDRWTM